MAIKKQKKLIKIVKKNVSAGTKKSKAEMLREAGYSNHQARRPSKVLGTSSFIEQFDREISSTLKIKTHKGLLKQSKIETQSFPIEATKAFIEKTIKHLGFELIDISKQPICGKQFVSYAVPDGRVRANGLDMAYKIADNYAKQKIEVTTGLEGLSDEDLDEKLGDSINLKIRSLQFKGQSKKKTKTK